MTTPATPEPIKSLSPRYSAIDARLARADAEVSRASLSIAAARAALLNHDTAEAAPEGAEGSAPSPEWQSMLENLLTACAASSAAVTALTDALAKGQLR